MYVFSGIAVPTVTPFDERGQFDEGAYRELVEWWIAQGVDAIVPCSSSGEAAYLTLFERNQVIQTAVRQAKGRVLVIAGTGFLSTNITLHETKAAAEFGADAALILTPYYYPLDQEALFQHYRYIAESSPIPIFLYNNPRLTHVNLEPQTVERLSEIIQIVGIKESSGSLAQIEQILGLTEPDFSVLCGSGELIAAALCNGADGAIAALANVVPKACTQLYDLSSLGKEAEAQEFNEKLLELNRAITVEYGIPGLKAALRAQGLPAGYPRLPLRPLDPTCEEKIREIMQRLNGA